MSGYPPAFKMACSVEASLMYFGKEDRANKQRRAQKILRRLKRTYRIRGPFVVWKNPLELLIGTVLSAQCTDVRVNMVTKTLFKKYKTARDYARAKLTVLEKEIYSTGFYRTKARYLKGIGEALVHQYDGNVPNRFEDLLMLPGVARKTANLIMAKAFGKPTGIAVDTHVFRVAPRLDLTKSKTPDAMAKDLEKLYAPKDYLAVNEFMVLHGRATCTPRKPKCPSCVLKNICPSAKKFYPSISNL